MTVILVDDAAKPIAAAPAILTATPSPIAPLPIPSDATEEQLIELWLHGKSSNTIRAYHHDNRRLPGVHRQADAPGVSRRFFAIRRTT